MSNNGSHDERRRVVYGEEAIERGDGGETHQITGDGRAPLTTRQGVPVADDQNSLGIGERGATALEDFQLREKIFHFDHERIPERVVHARGFGAHGYFENYESLSDVTRADLFQRPGEQTPVFVRFSTVAGNMGSPDLARDVRGFAVKLYTKQGNWDLVGNNMPVFFIQDAIKFPDLIHAAKQEPDRGFPQAQTAHDNFWDFASLMPESTHMLATPCARPWWRTFYHWKPKLGVHARHRTVRASRARRVTAATRRTPSRRQPPANVDPAKEALHHVARWLDLSRKRLDVRVLDDAGETALETWTPPDRDGLDSLVRRVR